MFSLLLKYMKVLNGLGSKSNIFKNAYSEFSVQCLKPDVKMQAAKDNFFKVGDLFIRADRADDFCKKTLRLTQMLQTSGNTKLSDLLINELSKLCLRIDLPQRAEKLLYLALNNCCRKNDGLHELARLNDLEYLYKCTHDRKNLIYVLKHKISCCKRILANYDENVKNFDSIKMEATPKSNVQTQLAFTYSDFGNLIERNNPKNAIKLLEKSKAIYEKLGRPKEKAYIKQRINELRARCNGS